MLKKDEVKDIIKLKDKEKLTYQEIAGNFNTNPSTIFYRYKLGKERYPEIFEENSKNIQKISKINLENPKNSLKKLDNPIPKIVRKVENPPGSWKPEEKKSKGEKKKVNIGNFKQNESKGIKINGNWLFFIIVSCVVALIAFFVAREIKKGEGGGGQKVEEPEPTAPTSPTPSIPEGREWANA